MTNDKDILKRFMAGESAACAELLTRLRPAVLSKLRLHHGGLRHAHDEILDAAETRLFEWRKETLGGGGQIDLDESIRDLAWRLAKQEAESEGRYQERNPLVGKSHPKSAGKSQDEDEEPAEWEQSSELTADERVNLGELEAAIDRLPEEMGLVLMAEAQRVMAGAEPLHEQLGITPEAARKRLERARKELKERLRQDSEGE
jgi:DNA-directed RNA polymerase specialized sigma24 family protein